MIKPPEKLSELAKMAMADLEQVEKDPRYKVNMHRWHERLQGVCQVCLAGAVMAKTLKYGPETARPSSTGSWHSSLMALDSLRNGWIGEALEYYGVKDYGFSVTSRTYVPFYEDGKEEWKVAMRGIIQTLEEKGL